MARALRKPWIPFAISLLLAAGTARAAAPACPPAPPAAQHGVSPFEDEDPDEPEPSADPWDDSEGDDATGDEDEPDKASSPLDGDDGEEAQA